MLHELFVYFGDESFVGCFVCEYFLPFCEFSFYFVGFLALQKLLTLIRSHLFIFVFIFITLIKKCVSEIYVSLLSTFRVKFILRTQLLLKVYRKRN